MYKKTKSIIATLLTLSIAMSIAITDTENSNSVVKNENIDKVQVNNVALLANNDSDDNMGERYYKAAENENLVLYVNNENLGLKVKNKTTGYVWSSTLDNRDKNLNQTWQAFAQSAVTVEYVDDKNKVRQLSLTSEKAKTNVVKKDSGFEASVDFDKRGIKLTLDVTLEGDNISIKVPYTSIEEKSTYKIQTIILYPFFGAVKGNNMNGYMFIPDGSGALISLKEKTNATQPYVGRVYGEDVGITGLYTKDENDNSLDPEQIYMPVFGMNQNNTNGYLAFVDGGAAYTEIEAYPSGITTDFNWIAAKFRYRDTYLQPIDKKGNVMTVNQKTKNSFDASIKYMFLSNEDSSYVGMAKRYQKELLDEGILKNNRTEDDKDLPVRLEFYAAENKTVLLWKKVIPMTTVEQMSSIIKDLNNNKVNNMSIVVNGWTKGGVTGSSPIVFPFEKKVGTAKQWENFIKGNEEKGIPVYMYSNFVGAYESSGGYKKSDIAQTISEQLLSFNDYFNYLNPNSTAKIFDKQKSKFDKYGINNIALGLIGKNLNSAYNTDNVLSRDGTIKAYENMLSKNSDIHYALYEPNQYLWKYTNAYLDIPMDSSNFMVETEAVPFMQIVLKGYVDFYAPVSNFYSNSTKETLKLIDYGAFPSFYLTSEDPVKFLDTDTDWLYTSQYSVWKNEIIKTYDKTNKALKEVKNAYFENREKLEEGVYKSTYSNGISVIVNYNDKEYKYNAVTVGAENFAVIGGNSK